MGGKAFTSGPAPLSTPRMPPSVYFKLRDQYLHLLRAIFSQAETPIEAPAKASYGDVDIVATEPKSSIVSNTTESLAKYLSAERTFKNPGSATTSFAVPYPKYSDSFVQLDLHVCPLSSYRWQVFFQSHGDLWNLLGTTIRPFGFTANDAGLHIRIAEIERLNRKRSFVFLTNEPKAVLELLGLDVEAYGRPFGSVEAMYEYVISCRFFKAETYVRADLKANDRKRMAQRELYSRFVEVWLPQNEQRIRTKIGSESTLTRDDVTDIALDRFGKRNEFYGVLEEWRRERRELLFKQEGRQQRKADALELEDHTNAWMEWLKQNKMKEKSC